jgi:hypothetical protein
MACNENNDIITSLQYVPEEYCQIYFGRFQATEQDSKLYGITITIEPNTINISDTKLSSPIIISDIRVSYGGTFYFYDYNYDEFTSWMYIYKNGEKIGYVSKITRKEKNDTLIKSTIIYDFLCGLEAKNKQYIFEYLSKTKQDFTGVKDYPIIDGNKIEFDYNYE